MANEYPKTGKELIRLAEKSDKVESIRPGKGSHFIVDFKNGTKVAIPVHGNEQIGKGLLRKIIKAFKAAGVLGLLIVFLGIAAVTFGMIRLP